MYCCVSVAFWLKPAQDRLKPDEDRELNKHWAEMDSLVCATIRLSIEERENLRLNPPRLPIEISKALKEYEMQKVTEKMQGCAARTAVQIEKS